MLRMFLGREENGDKVFYYQSMFRAGGYSGSRKGVFSSVSIFFGKVVLPGFQCDVLLFSGSWFYCIYLHAICE